MKKLHLLIIFLCSCLFSTAEAQMAQTVKPATLYFFNASGYHPSDFHLRTTLNIDKEIRVKRQECAVVRTDADSLVLIIRDSTYFVPFELGRDYYFIAYSSDYSGLTINEVSKSVFWLTAHTNNSKKPFEYFLYRK